MRAAAKEVKVQMHYYTISIDFPPPENVTETTMAEAVAEADRVVCQILDLMGVQHIHSYSWPDGSLYRYVRTKWTKEEFLGKFAEVSGPYQHKKIRVARIVEVDPFRETIKKADRLSGGTITTLNELFRIYISEGMPDEVRELIHDGAWYERASSPREKAELTDLLAYDK